MRAVWRHDLFMRRVIRQKIGADTFYTLHTSRSSGGILLTNEELPRVRAWFGDLGTQLGRKRLNVIVPSLKTRFGAPEPLVIWAQLHAAGSNLAVCLRAGPEILGTVA